MQKATKILFSKYVSELVLLYENIVCIRKTGSAVLTSALKKSLDTKLF